MNLNRYFRENSRTLLMVFMALLLVVWLLGDVISSWRDSSRQELNQKLGHSDALALDVYTSDLQRVAGDQRICQAVGFLAVQILNPVDMLLVTAEAERLGVRIGQSQVIDYVQNTFKERAGELLASIQAREGRSYEAIYASIGRWLAVEQLLQMQYKAFDESVPRLESTFRDTQQSVSIEYCVIDGRVFEPLAGEVSLEDIQKTFEEGKARVTAHTEDQLSFGYLQPNRVKVEYVTLDPRAIRSKVRIKETEAKRYFEEHAANYQKTVMPTTTSTQPAAATRVPMTWEEAREQARNDFRELKAVEEAQRVLNELRSEAYRPWASSGKDADGFRQPPAAAGPSLEELARKYSRDYEIVYGKSDWLTEQELRTFLNLNEPTYREGQSRLSASQLAMRVKGVFTPGKNEQMPVLMVNEPSPLLATQESIPGGRGPVAFQGYVFRVIEVAPSGPPASIDVVRDEIIRDIKRQRGFEMARTHAEQLAEKAAADGLLAASLADTALKEAITAAQAAPRPADEQAPRFLEALGPNTGPSRFTRRASPLLHVGMTANVPKKAFELAAAPPSATAPAHKVAAVPVASEFKCVVVAVNELKPLYQGDFSKQKDMLKMQSMSQRNMATMLWFDPTSIHERLGYKPAAGASADATQDAQQ
ncbi:periplasmic folding chaperone [Phycisphaerae bacterium RAS1]|nr:periplasmic folding chaperone [Phycisphaerae bacterium RAS1]